MRLALADFIGGATPLPAFEESIAKVLAAQGSGRGEVQAELQAAVNDGTLPPESLRRLGLIGPAVGVPDDPAVSPGPRPVPPAAIAPTEARAAAPPSPNRHIKPGVLLGGRYRLDRELGEGGMGVVYSAVDEEVRGEIFAIKVMKAEIREKPDSLRLLRDEVRRTRALRHANIVGVYSLNSDPIGVYMLMEHLEGKSLTTLLDEEFGRGMPLMRAWPVIWDIGAALAYAHDHNVIHSDLKPSNIFITTSGSAKLLDFGIARAVRTRSRRLDPSLMGGLTPAYASCEMFEGCAPDQSDDVYSFACVIYEMLTGRHPFNRMSSVEAHSRQAKPAPIPALTNRQNNALARALAFERAQRTRSVEELLEGLKGMATGKRRQQMRIASAAVALLATGLALYLGLHQRQATAPTARLALDEPTSQPSDAGLQSVPKPEARPLPRPDLNPAAARKKEAEALVPITVPISARKFTMAPVALTKSDEPRLADVQKSLATAQIPLEVPAAVPIEAPPPAPVAAAPASAPVAAAPSPAVTVAAGGPAAAAPAPKPGATALAKAATTAAPPTVAAAATPAAAPAVSAAAPAVAVATPAVMTMAMTSSAPSTSPEVSAPQPLPAAAPALPKDPEHPPRGLRIPSITALPDSQAIMNSDKCPYPVEARNRVETGTVELLVHVTPEGTVPNPQLSASSGSDSLDQAAISCIREFGRFPPKPGGPPKASYWGRTKFIWSFGD